MIEFLWDKALYGSVTRPLLDFSERGVGTRLNIDVNAIVRNTAAEVASGLPYTPQTFLIDCLLMDLVQGDTNRKQSENTCSAILSYIEKTMHPIRVDDLKVAKTDALKQRDREEIEAIDGQIHGYNLCLQHAS